MLQNDAQQFPDNYRPASSEKQWKAADRHPNYTQFLCL
jgi:hypothetical protein